MDHLPYPEHLGVPTVAVPYMPGYDYDHLDYESFPHRQGFIRNGALGVAHTCHEVAALAQSWLFFGLIEEFIGRPFDKNILIRKNFIGGDDEQRLIDTTKLVEILPNNPGRWLEKREAEEWFRIERRLAIAEGAIDPLEMQHRYDTPSSAVFLSIRILLIYLTEHQKAAAVPHRLGPITYDLGVYASPRLYRGQYRIACPGRWQKPAEPACFQLLVDRMRRSGWCLHQIMQILRSYNCLATYYLSSIRRPKVWSITHDTCTKEACLAYNTKQDKTYKIRHTKKGCRCQFVGPRSDQIVQIILKGGIPLIEIQDSGSKAVKLRVKEYTPGTKYTAISHVWIDGLGNPMANALPMCQLRKLRSQLLAMENGLFIKSRLRRKMGMASSTLFWMDTLCIPVNPQHDRERESLRRISIDRMALIYKSATNVLVRDDELVHIDYRAEPEELIHARLVSCRWNSRCWTLQEGALADSLVYQFRSSVYSVTLGLSLRYWKRCVDPNYNAFDTVNDSSNLIFALPTFVQKCFGQSPSVQPGAFGKGYLKYYFSIAAQRMCHMKYAKAQEVAGSKVDSYDCEFAHVWNNVGQRSTSKSEDIHVILANLADFSAAQIMSLPSAVERTKIMLHCIESFPLDLLFVECSRPWANGNHADRWIPAVPGPDPIRSKALLQHAGRGLEFHAKTRLNRDLRVCIADEGSYLQNFHFCFSYASVVVWAMIDCVSVENDQLPRDKLQPICLLLDLSCDSDLWVATKLRGARFYVQREAQIPGNLRVRYDCPFKIRLSSSPPSPKQLERYPPLRVTDFNRCRGLIIEQSIDRHMLDKVVIRSRSLKEYSKKSMMKAVAVLCFLGYVPIFSFFGWVVNVGDSLLRTMKELLDP